MPKVELIYFSGCPNVDDARQQLRLAFAQANMRPEWIEWDTQSADAPQYTHSYGSPTILVNGRDVMPDPHASDAACCRVYAAQDAALRGVPTVEAIRKALRSAVDAKAAANSRTRLLSLAALPAAGSALLPAVGCPACWPAYTTLLGAFGIGFVDYTPWLLPMTVALFGLAFGGLAWGMRRRGPLPLLTGLSGGAAVVVGKYAMAIDALIFAGIALLVVASIWNLWPNRQRACADGRCDDRADHQSCGEEASVGRPADFHSG